MCEFCETNNKNKCKPLVRILDKLNGYEKIALCHLLPSKSLPNRDCWAIEATRFGVGIYAKVNYCPMCGRELGEKK